MRDLHTLHWLASYLHPEKAVEDFVEATESSRGTSTRLSGGARTSCGPCAAILHFLTGRPEERLSFDYAGRSWRKVSATATMAGLRAVERFMKHYFLVAKDVGDLTRIVCSALEVKQLKTTPG